MNKKAAKPQGIFVNKLFNRMNDAHQDLVLWAFSKIKLMDDIKALDIGFGGGVLIDYLLKNNVKNITGIDISSSSIRYVKKKHRADIKSKRLSLIKMGAEDVNKLSTKYDLITSFCTIRFWPNLGDCFKNIYESLNKNGLYLIGSYLKTDVNDVLKILEETGFKKITTYRNEKGYSLIVSIK